MLRSVACIVFTLAVPALAQAQTPAEAPREIQAERLAEGFAFTEGPAVGPDGAIYFSDIPKRKVHRFDPKTNEMTVFMEDSGGSNGLHWDHQGRLVLCADKSRMVTRRESDGSITILEDQFDGKKLNSPNDLDIDSQGGIYFTDPSWAKRENRDMDEMGVYYIPPAQSHPSADGLSLAESADAQDTPAGTVRVPPPAAPAQSLEVKRLITDLKKPNGIALSPDEKTLYVADNDAGLVMAYDVTAPGEVANPRVFVKPDAKGGPDGMTTDTAGNLYAAWYGANAVFVWNPEGQMIAKITHGPGQPTNVELADNETTLYITGGNTFQRAKLK